MRRVTLCLTLLCTGCHRPAALTGDIEPRRIAPHAFFPDSLVPWANEFEDLLRLAHEPALSPTRPAIADTSYRVLRADAWWQSATIHRVDVRATQTTLVTVVLVKRRVVWRCSTTLTPEEWDRLRPYALPFLVPRQSTGAPGPMLDMDYLLEEGRTGDAYGAYASNGDPSALSGPLDARNGQPCTSQAGDT